MIDDRGHISGMEVCDVLLVEDDVALRDVVKRTLERADFTVQGRGTGAEALAALARSQPRLLVLDIGLPDTDGRDLCQAIRARGVDVPVIFLTARDTRSDLIAGFEAGGDDYVVKPFDAVELVARCRALVRRSAAGVADDAAARPHAALQLDPVAHTAATAAGRVALTPTEFRMLATIAAHAGSVATRRELRAAAWPHGAMVSDNTIDAHVARLRRKLATLDPPQELTTVQGGGYGLR